MQDLIPGLPDEIGRECLIRVPYERFSVVIAVCRRWKGEFTSPEFHRRRKLAGFGRSILALTQVAPSQSEGVKIFPVTPTFRLAVFEPATGLWDRLIPVPGYSDGLPIFCECVGVGRNLVVIGGWDPLSFEVSVGVFVYDFFSGRWRRGKDLPARRSFFACASDSGTGERGLVLVAGGHDDSKNALRSALVYDVADDKWIPLPDMAVERDECKCVYVDGKFHVIGGYRTDSQGQFKRSKEAFDLATWQWGPLVEDALEVDTCPRSCVADESGRVYLCHLGKVMAFDSNSATWRVVEELPPDVLWLPYMVTWQKGKFLVTGSRCAGGPRSLYTLAVGDRRSAGRWTRLEPPVDFSGNVGAGCCIDI